MSCRPLIPLVVLSLVLGGCSPASETSDRSAPTTRSPGTSPDAAPSASATPEPSPDDPAGEAVAGLSKARLRRLRVNEAGVVPVLMYHRITDGGGEYDRTAAEFKAELLQLWRDGYRPISAADLATGHVDVPAGKSPVVLTFDDSSVEQFALTHGGNIGRGTAVDILLRFARSHPAFGPAGTFFVNERPFNDDRWPRMLRRLHDLGFEIGNHTLEHVNLGAVPKAEVQRQLALGAQMIRRAVPTQQVRTFALPLGIRPSPPSLARSGAWRGIRYRHDGVFLVGSGPAPSPFVRIFRPLAIPRIRSAEQPRGTPPTYGSEFWLKVLRGRRTKRYISDGDPSIVTVPRALRKHVRSNFDVRTY